MQKSDPGYKAGNMNIINWISIYPDWECNKNGSVAAELIIRRVAMIGRTKIIFYTLSVILPYSQRPMYGLY